MRASNNGKGTAADESQVTFSTGPRRPVPDGADRTDIAAGLIRPFARSRSTSAPDSTWEAKALSSSYSSTGSITHGLQVELVKGGDKEISRPYLQNPWVYACCQAVARAVASLPLVVRAGPDDQSPLVESGPLVDLLRRPNPLTSMRKQSRLMTLYDLLFGESFLFLMGEGVGSDGELRMAPVRASAGMGPAAKIDMPKEAWLVRGDVVRIVQDQETGMPIGWKYTAARGQEVTFPAHAVVQIAEADPYNPLRGLGPMTAAWRTAQKDFVAERYDEALLANGGTPGVTLSLPKGSMLTRDQKKELARAYQENHARPEKHRAPMLLEEGLKAEVIAFQPKDMELGDMRRWDRETYMAVFGVTKPVLGITDDVNRANAREAMRAFWEITILPKIDFFGDELNSKMIQRLPAPMDGYSLHFDTSGVRELQEEAVDFVDSMCSLVGCGRSINEAAEILGIDIPEDLEGGDDRYLNSNLVPIELAGTQFSGVVAEASGGAERVKSSEEDGRGVGKEALDPLLSVEASEEYRALPEYLQDAQYQAAYVERIYQGSVDDEENALRRKSGRVFKDYVLAMRRRLEEEAGRYRARSNGQVDAVKAPARELDELLRRGMEQWEEAMLGAVDGPMDGLWDVAAESMAEELGAEAFISSESPRALQFLRSKKIKVVEGVMSTVAEDVRSSVLRALVEGNASTGSLARRLAEALSKVRSELGVMANNVGARAARIARTESTAIVSRARFDEMRSEEIDRHMWLTAGGPVRETHVTLNRRIRRLGESFGHNLRYPGDQRATAANVVNCRCGTVPIRDKGKSLVSAGFGIDIPEGWKLCSKETQ